MNKKLDHSYLAGSIGLLNPREPILIKPERTIAEAIDALGLSQGGAILIVDEDEKLLGIFTERDIIKKVLKEKIPFSDSISSIMTSNPASIEMTSPIGFALQLMSEGGFRQIPIVDQTGFPIGIVSIKDILDEFVRSFVCIV